jgi:heptosyltransferase II
MKFLIVQTAFLGDVVLATPIIEKLRRFYPEAHIDFLLRKGNESLLQGHPALRHLWIWDKKNGKYRDLLRVARGIRRERYDWVINCQRFGASGLLTVLSGARHTVGFDKNPFSVLFTRRTTHRYGTAETPLHETDRNLSLIKHLTDDSGQAPRLYPSQQDHDEAARLAAGRPYVCMAPNAVWFTKQWPEHKWTALVASMPADHTVFLLGGGGDAASCERIRARAPHPERVVNLAGRASLLAAAALMQHARMSYVNDSAPIHLASAVDAPVTAVFCSTVPAFGFTPLSTVSVVWETPIPLACRPCGLHGRSTCPQGHFSCAEGIPVPEETVF